MSASPKTESTLQLEEDIAFERREWRAQRIGWVLMAFVIAAALAGAFGNGYLSHARARGSDSNLVVSYDRIVRYGAPTVLEFQLTAPTAAKELQLWIARPYLDGLEIQSVLPEPTNVTSAPGSVIYSFGYSGAATTQPHKVRFLVQPTKRGARRGKAGVPGYDSVAFAQFVLP